MVATWKKDLVDELSKKVKSKKVVGIVSISNVPSKQMQSMRRKLGDQLELIVARGSIIKRALEKAKVTGLDEFIDGPTGVVFTDIDPFRLEKLLDKNKTYAPAKAGYVPTEDITVPEGDTGLPAGPVIGDIQGAGIKAKIDSGKIKILQDSVVVKAGEPVPENVAPVLSRLGIEPMEIVLLLRGAFEAGIVYSRDVLHIDPAQTMATFQDACTKAFNLSYNARIFNSSTIELLISEAICNARNLMINAEILNKETIGIYLARADSQAKALRAALPEDLAKAVEAAEEPAEDKPAEEPKAEDKPAEESKAEEPAEDKPAEESKAEEPAEDKPAEESKAEEKPAEESKE